MNKWIKLLVFLPIPLFMLLINYLVDPSGIFHDDYQAVAKSVLDGNNVLILRGNINEREVKHQLIENLPEHVECIAVGPSLVMGVRKDDVGTENFYNLGESGADFYDILAQFGLLELNHKKYDRVIFCVDTYFFDENLNKTFTRNRELRPFADYMLTLLDGAQDIPVESVMGKKGISQYKELLSVSYFQSSLQLVKKQGREALVGERWTVVDKGVYDKAYYMADGSWVYALKTQKQDEKDVIKESNEYNVEKQFSKGKHLSSYQQETFEKLLQYLQARHVQVELFLCPVSPTLWGRIDNDDYHVLGELESFAHSMADKYNLKLTGAYNPHTLGMGDKDFYDSRHVRHELLSTYFDFKP
ncbi:MAG: hypothetical protein E7203_03630 [Selenomonas ruminantium]|uniref:Uncharacterized protein n=1 Tax=Selenomonas ruminantium TaxID=971 RepID=A0A927WLM2_SELRU|nr:hypothetical protein [Selenomonas ruminantium]MBE6084550.1 hypothetical protein [Selenomonas ruminantium]